MRSHGGTSSTLILFQSLSSSGSTRGLIRTNSPQQASGRRRLRRSRRLRGGGPRRQVHAMGATREPVRRDYRSGACATCVASLATHTSADGVCSIRSQCLSVIAPADPSAAAKLISKADVEAMLAKLADEQDEDYDWRMSIVDLMKLLKLDAASAPEKTVAPKS